MNKQIRTILIISGITLILGIAIGNGLSRKNGNGDASVEKNEEAERESVYTCSMHSQIRTKEPGDCPICGMELVLVSGDENDDRFSVKMSENAMKLANVRTMIVGQTTPARTVRLDGKVEIDERRISSLVSHFPGRVESLKVNFTGEFISKGQVIAMIYSPDLLTASKELLEAYKLRDSQPSLYDAARRKLENWKLSSSEIDRIISSGVESDVFPLIAQKSGYVNSKNVNVGDYVRTGSVIFEVADLSGVWVLFDIHESDLAWVNKGDEVAFSVSSLPGNEFLGKVTYIDPVINPYSRVAKARVEMTNERGMLKPAMFVSGTINSKFRETDQVLSVPKSAVMWTGDRSIVYVRTQNQDQIAFEMREVKLGPPLSENYIIRSGLEKGDVVVVNGTFSVDAAAQLQGKPSMMNPSGASGSQPVHHHVNGVPSALDQKDKKDDMILPDEQLNAMQPLFKAYFGMKDALSKDDLKEAKNNGILIVKILNKMNLDINGGHEKHWKLFRSDVLKQMEHIEHGSDFESVRDIFWSVSKSFIHYAEMTHSFKGTVYVQYCPMADDNKGASWLSTDSSIKNPYFGSAMLECGEIVNKLDRQ